jgi:hypothetical protein
MSEHYPRIRIQTESGYIRVREGLNLTFYMRPPHQEIAQSIQRSLDVFLRYTGPTSLGLYASEDGEWRELNDAGWNLIRRELREEEGPLVNLHEASETGSRYAFIYYGKSPDFAARMNEPDAMCEATFWLPTEFLEEQGPGRVRELAIELVSLLPLCSGYCGLSFNGELDMVGVSQQVARYWLRYPGIDVPSPYGHSWDIGTRLRGPHWMNFFGQPVLEALGEAKGLRAQLHSPGTTVQELEGDRVLVTLGEWPEAGDTERGDLLPAYRELARLLEPWLYHERMPKLRRPEAETRRWVRRFLD